MTDNVSIATASVADQVADPQINSQECPAQDQRKISPKETWSGQAVTVDEQGVWHIQGYDEVRQVLRSELVKQAGFNAEDFYRQSSAIMHNPPILYLDGEVHHKMRRETNKYFTPAITDQRYRDFMNAFADQLVGKIKQDKRADLNDVTMQMAMKVAAQVVGLTDSALPGMNQRLVGMLNSSTNAPKSTQQGRKPNIIETLWAQRPTILFLLLDVKPAVRARRRKPQNDVISYLIERKYSDIEILTECIVYGVAGMVTTREFICTAFLHLMDNPHLRQRMSVGSQPERYAILHEILRLEPIVGHLYRRTTDAIQVETAGQQMTIPADTLVELNVFASNLDLNVVGDNATAICPERSYHSTQGKVGEGVLSFGDGMHRCPGSYIAIQESDIFLQKLLSIEGLRVEHPPELVFNPVVQGYEIHNLPVVID